MLLSTMPSESAWKIDERVWHVAKGRDDRWKVHREGEATATSRHDTKDEALDAARALAENLPDTRIKVHEPDGSVEDVLDPLAD